MAIDIKLGDCLELIRQIPTNSIDCIITDPPYGMDFQSGYRKEKYIKIQNDTNLDWLKPFLLESNRVLKDNSHFYIFCSYHNLDLFMLEVKKLFNLKNILVWVKNNTSMGDLEGDYAPQYEFIIFIQKGRRLLNGTRKSNVLNYDRTNNKYHPTEKPLELIRFLVRNSTNTNELILDPFMGSGTTAVTCKELKRDFIGFEIEEEHFKTTEKRLKQVNSSVMMFNKEE